MSFDFRAVFTGVCAYVPNRPLGNGADIPSKLMVMMVDARQEGRRARDGSDLEPHYPVVAFRSANLGAGGDGPDLVWILDRQMLEIRAQENDPSLNDFHLAQGQVTGDPVREDFRFCAQMAEIAPDFQRIDARCFRNQQSRGLISARALIERGRVSAYDVRPGLFWRFNVNARAQGLHDTSLGARNLEPRILANRVALILRDLEGLQLVATHLDTGERTTLRLGAPGGGQVDVTIGNVCRGCLPPKIFAGDPPHLGDHVGDQQPLDEDFRWIYELSERRDDIQLPRGIPLPIPRHHGGNSGNGVVQCMGGTFAHAEF